MLKKGSGPCQARYLKSDRFETLVVNQIKERIPTEENLRWLVRLVNEEMDVAGEVYREQLEIQKFRQGR